MRCLVVAAPAPLRSWVVALRRAGFAVDAVRTRAAALDLLSELEPDAVVVMTALADGDGLDVLAAAPGAASVAVTPSGADEERATALAAGADDAVTPPVTTDELVLRVAKALVRRTEPTGIGLVRLGPVTVDRAVRRVNRDGAPLELTPTELCVLDHLVANRHRLVPPGELLDRCWDARRDMFSNPLSSQVWRLRGHLAGAVEIRWVNRGGYIVEAAPEAVGNGSDPEHGRDDL